MKKSFKDIASEEKRNIDYEVLSKEILIPSENVFSFLNKYGDLYNFWHDLLFNNINWKDIRLHQIKFLKDLLNGFEVYKIIKKPKNESDYKAEDLYLKLLGDLNKTVNDIFLNKPTDKYNEKMYLQAWILFNLRENLF